MKLIDIIDTMDLIPFYVIDEVVLLPLHCYTLLTKLSNNITLLAKPYTLTHPLKAYNTIEKHHLKKHPSCDSLCHFSTKQWLFSIANWFL